jgi:archaellum component FlaF (FlaF/FlaG flagellin family)
MYQNKFWFNVITKNVIIQGSEIVLDPQYIVSTGGITNSTSQNNGRKLARTSNGTLCCVFHAVPPGNTKYNIYCAESYDNGQTWTKTLLINDSSFNQYNPSIAIDGNDYTYVVWQGAFGADRGTKIRYCIKKGTWGKPQNVTAIVGNYNQVYPAIAVDSTNNLHVVWQGMHSGSTTFNQIRYSKYSSSWSAPINITTVSTTGQYAPSIAIDSNDYVHVVWYGQPASLTANTIRYSKYTTSWSAPINISNEGLPQEHPSIAIDKNDYIHVVWDGNHAGSIIYYQIRYSYYKPSVWSKPVNLTSASATQYSPSISIPANISLHVVWYGGLSIASPTTQIRYTRHYSTWSTPKNLTLGLPGKLSPSLIWAYYPSTINASRPEKGYAFVFMNDTVVTYNASPDLSWRTKHIFGMTRATYLIEMNSGGSSLTGYIGNTFVTTTIDTNWHYIAMTFNGINMKLYKDGAQTNSYPVLMEIAYPSTIPNVTAGGYLTGWLDELRISNIIRSADWINTTYRNQHTPAAFLYFGDERSVYDRGVNITVENIGDIILQTNDFDILINGTLYQFTCSHPYVSPENHVFFNTTESIQSGEKRIKVVTDNGIVEYYLYPG